MQRVWVAASKGSKIDTAPAPHPHPSPQRPLCGSGPLESWRITLFPGALVFVLFFFFSALCFLKWILGCGL